MLVQCTCVVCPNDDFVAVMHLVYMQAYFFRWTVLLNFWTFMLLWVMAFVLGCARLVLVMCTSWVSDFWRLPCWHSKWGCSVFSSNKILERMTWCYPRMSSAFRAGSTSSKKIMVAIESCCICRRLELELMFHLLSRWPACLGVGGMIFLGLGYFIDNWCSGSVFL